MHVLHAPTADLARSIVLPVLTVEAEYGSYVCEGRFYTAAHHQGEGPYAGRHLPGHEATGRPSPCNDDGITRIGEEDVVVVSHIDLDTLGGCLRATGRHGPLFTPEFSDFWELAEFVDVSGPHRMDPAHPEAHRLQAVWAWLQDHRPQYPRDEIVEVTVLVLAFGDALRSILAGDEAMLAAGQAMADAADALNELSFGTFLPVEGTEYGIITREADQFTNHMYRTPGGGLGAVVVALNGKMRSVTISLESPIEGVNCCELVQALWGPEAGGHAGIAGSPRGQVMGWSDVEDLCDAVRDVLSNLTDR